MQGITPLVPYLTLGLTQPHPNCYQQFNKLLINSPTAVIGNQFRGITPFDSYLTLGMTELHTHCSPSFTRTIIIEWNLVIEKN